MATEPYKDIKISVRHLSKNYDNLEVIRDVSLDVYEGEVVCIIGPSGGGKSTFLRCINRLEECTSGTIYVNQQDITGKADKVSGATNNNFAALDSNGNLKDSNNMLNIT